MPIDPPPSTLDAHLGYWLRIVSNAVSQSFARKVEAEGVTVAEWVFLRVLYDAGSIAPSELSERMGMTKGAISKLADRLAEKSLIERKSHPQDRRSHALALNKEGRALVPRLAKLADQNDAEFFDALAADERHRLEQILGKIIRERELTQPAVD